MLLRFTRCSRVSASTLWRASSVARRFVATNLTTPAEAGAVAPPDVGKHLYLDQEQSAIRNTQAPNRTDTWAPSQRPRSLAMTGPRFNGKDLSKQPQPLAAIDLIAHTPVHFVSGMAVCDGNEEGFRGGIQGHPKVYINTDKPGIHVCPYCGTRYADEKYEDLYQKGELGLFAA